MESATSRSDTKQLFARSAFYNANIPKGTVLEDSHFSMKKPGGGLNFDQVKTLLGKTINKDRSFDDFIELGDFT